MVTNHNEPEAVILAVEAYERLAALQAPDAGDRLRAVMVAPARGDAALKAGCGV